MKKFNRIINSIFTLLLATNIIYAAEKVNSLQTTNTPQSKITATKSEKQQNEPVHINQNHVIEDTGNYKLEENKDNTITLVEETGDSVFTEEQLQILEKKCLEFEEKNKIGIYCILTQNMYVYQPSTGDEIADIRNFNEFVFKTNNIGYPASAPQGDYNAKSMISLAVDMYNRKYDIYVTKRIENAYSEYGRELIINHITRPLKSSDWFKVFDRFIEKTSEITEVFSTTGKAASEPKNWKLIIGIALVFAIIFGLTAAYSEKAKLSNIKLASEADNYVPDGAIKIDIREDTFTHSTEIREKINDNNSGGISHSSGSSGSHSSGSF